ncbi:alpha/beta-hydrolase [Chiua virens]|nr:alpha/beta-hydrolase [Chiua virens]
MHWHFTFRQQPLKTLYIIYTLFLVLSKLPYWTLISLPRAWRPRRNWSLGRSVTLSVLRTIVDMVYATGLFIGEDAEKSAKSADKLGFVWVEPLSPELIKGEIASLAAANKTVSVRVYGFWYGKDVGSGSHGGKARPNEKVLYHFHGGGYVMGSASPNGQSGSALADYVRECSGVVERGFFLNYRLSSAAPFQPENPFPAAVIDALAGYKYLIDTLGFKPTNVIVSGDSAGGHLAFTLVRYLVREAISELPPPGATVLFSPTVDWACTHDAKPGSSMTRNVRCDVVQPILHSGYTARGLCGSLGADSVETNAWISPASLSLDTRGLFTNFTPTLILAGGAEQTLDPIKTLYDRLQADNDAAKIKYTEFPEASHDFVMMTYHEPEKTEGAKEVARWLETVYGK